MSKFSDLNVNPLILKGIEKMKYEEMTEVQEKVIPFALEGNDIIAQAPTGTGKTIAFAIPLLDLIDTESIGIQAIVISPTRELAVQITREINAVAFYLKEITAVAVYGGEAIEKQFMALKKRPQIVVATPGRLLDHIKRGTVKLQNVKYIVLDEADEMLDMGFKEDIDLILSEVKEDHQTLLYSATISKGIEEIAKTFLHNPQMIRINKNLLTVPSIEQKYIELKEKDKIEVMSRLIDINEYKLVMVFCNTKKGVDEVTSELIQRGFMAEALHGDMKQMQRDRVMNRFRNGHINILVASDVAARGLDIDDVEVVFNYDLPTDEEYYVHRIGRTGRAKKDGLSITFVTRNEKYKFKSIINYAKATVTLLEVPDLDTVIKSRVKRIIQKAIDKISDHEDKNYCMISRIIKNYSEVDEKELIKGLLLLLITSNENNVEIENTIEEIKSREKTRSSNGQRMFINIGRKDKIKVYNLTDLIVEKTNLTNADVNAIELCETFSFFEIPKEFVSEVLALSGILTYNDRIIIIEESKGKSRSSSTRSGRSSRDENKYDSSAKPLQRPRRRDSSSDTKERSSKKTEKDNSSRTKTNNEKEGAWGRKPRRTSTEKTHSPSRSIRGGSDFSLNNQEKTKRETNKRRSKK